ncbi:MAG TPA: hypothetical protein GX500_01985 [Firmicutes bacterium]|nr:hypothetical protein [Candidatus Fermentithermobacillaceae bacterium]
MKNLTSRELLYLEDAGKLFECVAKVCDFAASNAVDPQFKAYLQALGKEHKQWMAATAEKGQEALVQ